MPFTSIELELLSNRELRAKCKKAGLSTDGTAHEMMQRLSKHPKHQEEAFSAGSWVKRQPQLSKEQKKERTEAKSKVSSAEDLTCPITLELLLDPVVAEDGRLYERAAIEKHFGSKSLSQIRSPYTNAPMGRRLLPAPQIKSLIGILVTSGTISGDVAKNWIATKKLEKAKESLLNKANCGDEKTMYTVAVYYANGRKGFPKDKKISHYWAEQAHMAGNPTGTAMFGNNLLNGNGVKKDAPTGAMHLATAAAQGSNFAAYILATALLDGTLAGQKKEARRFLEMALRNGPGTIDHMRSSHKEEAKRVLEDMIREEGKESHKV